VSSEVSGSSPHAIKPYRGKRAFDLLAVAALSVPAAVLAAGSALAVRCTSRGPVLFRQTRVGMHGEPFEMLKFRTMLDGDNPIIPADDRITRIGRVLRRTSLDELPQLINVIRGEMSIVGPRPTLQYQVDRYDDRQRGRLWVRPGLTGLAQVAGRNDLLWADRIELDLDYVSRQSARFDMAILVRTGRAVIDGSGSGATAADDPLAAPAPDPATAA